jgi:hypothetical protein
MPIIITLKTGKTVVVKGESPFPLKETARKGILQLTDANGNGYWPEQSSIQDWAFLPQAKYDEAVAKQKEQAEKQRADAEAKIKRLDEQRKRDDEMQERSRALQMKELARREAKQAENERLERERVEADRARQERRERSVWTRALRAFGKKAKP